MRPSWNGGRPGRDRARAGDSRAHPHTPAAAAIDGATRARPGPAAGDAPSSSATPATAPAFAPAPGIASTTRTSGAPAPSTPSPAAPGRGSGGGSFRGPARLLPRELLLEVEVGGGRGADGPGGAGLPVAARRVLRPPSVETLLMLVLLVEGLGEEIAVLHACWGGGRRSTEEHGRARRWGRGSGVAKGGVRRRDHGIHTIIVGWSRPRIHRRCHEEKGIRGGRQIERVCKSNGLRRKAARSMGLISRIVG